MAGNVSGAENEKCSHTQKEGESVLQTDHTGYVYTTNQWGSDLQSLTIRHRRGNDPSQQEETTYYNVSSGARVGPLEITYTTGAGSPFDYWWIKFTTVVGKSFSMKDSFYCYISSSDNGTVNLRIDGATSKMYVSFSSSSGCTVSIYEVVGKEG